MKKPLLLLLLSFSYALGHIHPSLTSKKQALAIPRGGDLGPIPAKSLAQTFSALSCCDAVLGSLAPRTSMKWFNVDIEPNSLPEHYLHGIGASSATVAVSTYLATNSNVSLEHAIGYGFIARLIMMTLMLATNKFSELGMNKVMFGSMWTVMLATTIALFQNISDAMVLTKVVSLLLVFHGLFLYLKPEAFLKRADTFFDRDSLTTKMASIDGGYMVMSGVVTFMLASKNMDPTKVCGYAALSFVPILYKLLDVVECDSFFCVDTGVWAVLLSVVIASIVVGTLH